MNKFVAYFHEFCRSADSGLFNVVI